MKSKNELKISKNSKMGIGILIQRENSKLHIKFII